MSKGNFKPHNPPKTPKGRDGYYTKPSGSGRGESYGPKATDHICSEKTPSLDKAYGDRGGRSDE